MLTTARKILALFAPAEQRQLLGVMAAILAMGMLQLLGVGSVLPFVGVLTNPDLIQSNATLAWAYSSIGFSSTNGFLLFLGLASLIFLVSSNAFLAFTLWLMTRFAWSNQQRLSSRLLQGYLAQPYEAFLQRNSADTGKNILIESQQVTNGVILPAMRMVAFGVTTLFIIGFLVWLNPVLALLVGTVFGTAYALAYLCIRRPMMRFGKQRAQANRERFQAVNEAFGSIKEVKVLNREQDFVARYDPAASVYARTMASVQVLGQLPRYAIESIAFGVVISLFLFLLYTRSDMQAVLPLASAFALAGYRLLPALQQVYGALSSLRFNQSILDTIHHDLTAHPVKVAKLGHARPNPLSFNQELRLSNVCYAYPEAAEHSLKGVDLAIPYNTFVAFVGATGAGKTTLADMVLGLLPPQSGTMTVDSVPLTALNMSAWQANLGYVPQEIYLTDDTIAANIAYGIASGQVDKDAVERAARIANIHDFVMDKLPKGYQTMVGERGVRLSGGQRQRIGIARALYHDPKVLVLDEATSALDNETERRIVEELDAMRGGRTLIVIAHRLSTVRRCHCLYLLSEGQLVAKGDYDELLDTNAEFCEMAQNNSDGVRVATTQTN